MKKNIVSLAFMAVFLLMGTNSQAQSWKDLLNKDNISKVVNAITGTPETIDMTGTWNYKGSAVEFESENLLMKAGGAAAATMAENKLDEQLSKVGIKAGQMNFTFNADSTFTSTGKRNCMVRDTGFEPIRLLPKLIGSIRQQRQIQQPNTTSLA